MYFLSPTRLHRLGLPVPSPSGQYLTYTAPMSSSSVAMTSDTCATSATALVASVSQVMGSLTVQCMAAPPPPGEGVAMELSRASSMASRSGHGDAGEDDDDDDDARPPTKPRRGMMGRRAAWGRRGDAREEPAHPPLGMRAMHDGVLASTRAPARATRDIAAHSSARSDVRSLCQIAKHGCRAVENSG
jgi:hypothetical protein